MLFIAVIALLLLADAKRKIKKYDLNMANNEKTAATVPPTKPTRKYDLNIASNEKTAATVPPTKPTTPDNLTSAAVDINGGLGLQGDLGLQGGVGLQGGLGLQTSCDLEDFTCISKQHHISYLFPTPLMYQQIVVDQRSAFFNHEIKELMLELEAENDGCKFNLHGGYRSKDGFLSRSEDSIRWLKEQIIERARVMLTLSGAPDTPFYIDGWGAVLRHGHGQTMHVHPQSIYAGVYYVAAPDAVLRSGKRGGCLTFHDPRAGAEMNQFVRGKDLYGTKAEVCPPMNGGMLVMFPSWLPHEVHPMPNEEGYEGPRIAVSFNVMYKYQ